MRDALKAAPPLAQLAVLILVGVIAMSIIAGLYTLVLALTGVDVTFLAHLDAVKDPFGVKAYSLKALQLAQAIGLFVIPYWIYRSVLGQPSYRIGLAGERWVLAVLFGASMVAALPMINYLAEWNAGLSLPEAMGGLQEWIVDRESDVERLLEVFLYMETPWHLIANLLLIAVVPAISEELFFRGTFQPLAQRMVGNHHVAIWLTAFFFSFFHMQFLGFFPRMLLGAVFGYAAHWSGSLMLPMIGHLINNGLAVTLAYFIGIEALNEQTETLGANEGEWTIAVTSALVLIAGMFAIRRRSAGYQHGIRA